MNGAERLYELLPAVYRTRDADFGSPLRALLGLIGAQVDLLDADLDRLYRNAFIETCDEWAVPFIADLVSVRTAEAGILFRLDEAARQRMQRAMSSRATVGNAIRSRRRKGTLSVLQSLAYDVARWPALAVEFRTRVLRTVDFRRLPPRPSPAAAAAAAAAAEPCETKNLTDDRMRPGTVDFRDRSAMLRAGTIDDRFPHLVDFRTTSDSDILRGRYRPRSIVLFVLPSIVRSVKEAQAERVDDTTYRLDPFRRDLVLFTNPETEAESLVPAVPLRLTETCKRDFDLWIGANRAPVEMKNFRIAPLGEETPPDGFKFWLNPRTGELKFKDPPIEVRASYHHAADADFGGGSYQRSREPIPSGLNVLYVRFSNRDQQGRADPQTLDNAITECMDKLGANKRYQIAVIEIADSDIHQLSKDVQVPEDCSLFIRAADGARPILKKEGEVRFLGGPQASIAFDGVGIAAGRVVFSGFWKQINVAHATIADPASGPSSIAFKLGTGTALVRVAQSIVGSLKCEADPIQGLPSVRIEDSIVAGPILSSRGGDLPAPIDLTVVRSTIRGEVSVELLSFAENSIFVHSVTVNRPESGCVRFSSIGKPVAIPAQIEPARTPPVFRNRLFRKLGYYRLRSGPVYVADGVRRPEDGAEDGSEMGAYHDLFHPLRLQNLRLRLQEFTPASAVVDLVLVDAKGRAL